ncbi:unnamed protein product [Amoebophrya sp. A120]|nr:unnamed protein product [Amoebophrya sp. A120]|eukprot:GSA120T00004104001.1
MRSDMNLLLHVFLLTTVVHADPVLGSVDSRTVCAPAAIRTPLQKLELQLSWPSTEPQSGMQKFQDQLALFAGATSSRSVPFTLSANPVPRGLLCRLLFKHAHYYVTKVFAPFLCEDCHDGCAPSCVAYPVYKEDSSSAQQQRSRTTAPGTAYYAEDEARPEPHAEPIKQACEVNSPAQCLFLESTKANLPRNLKADWVIQIDHLRVFLLFSGIFSVLFYKTLGRSQVVHWALGGVLGLLLFASVVMYYAFRSTKNALPFGQKTFAIMNMMVILAPTMGLYAWQTMLPSFQMVQQLVVTVASLQDPYYEFPVGAVVVGLALLSGIMFGQYVFGVKETDIPMGQDIAFTIASNGARIDHIPDEDDSSRARKFLQYGIFVYGIIAVLKSTTVPAMNIFILFILLAWNSIWHSIESCRMRREVASQAEIHTSYLSPKEYSKQAKANTQKELEKLRAFLTSQDGRKHITNVYIVYGNLNLHDAKEHHAPAAQMGRFGIKGSGAETYLDNSDGSTDTPPEEDTSSGDEKALQRPRALLTDKHPKHAGGARTGVAKTKRVGNKALTMKSANLAGLEEPSDSEANSEPSENSDGIEIFGDGSVAEDDVLDGRPSSMRMAGNTVDRFGDAVNGEQYLSLGTASMRWVDQRELEEETKRIEELTMLEARTSHTSVWAGVCTLGVMALLVGGGLYYHKQTTSSILDDEFGTELKMTEP